jgi:hypothetical protein
MDITTLSAVELKAIAYDEMVRLQLAQQNITAINQELAKREKEMSVPKAEENGIIEESKSEIIQEEI